MCHQNVVEASRVLQLRLLLLSNSSTRTPSAELIVHAAFPYLFSRQMWQLLEFLVSTQTPSAGLIECVGNILLCLFLLYSRQARGRGVVLFLSSIFPSAHLLLSFSLSIAEDELTNCLHMLRGVDEAEKDWRLFDIWDRCFDKLPVISAKLSLRVTGADASGKAKCLSDF
ncbi:hypothetical protein PS1_016057 [Malus domestica]